MTTWEAVIGLEVHARLTTNSKLFCGCDTAYGAPPNSRVCPVCLGYPGALPVLNRRAIELAIRVALAAECKVELASRFARKNYFYPDLPKGYQISQFDRPLALGGHVDILTRGEKRRIGLVRIHVEEDAGKSLHENALEGVSDDVSLIDLNRAGTPLIEIVSSPDIGSAEEAIAYFTRLRQILMYAEACDGNMEEGSLRCDANVSVRRPGDPLGTRAEIKNLNSFRFLGRAIEFEIERQTSILESGGTIVQETRLFDAAAGETRSMRSKEEAHDYRYFAEPDLLSLVISQDLVDDVRRSLPEMPGPRAERYRRDHGLSIEDSETLVTTRQLSDYFDAVVAASGNARAAANWVKNGVIGMLNELKIPVDDFRVRPDMLGRLIALVDGGRISGKAAKDIFDVMAISGGSPDELVERLGLAQTSDPAAIADAARRVLAAHGPQVAQYKSGKTSMFGFFVGQLMKETRGKANPELANTILRELLDAAEPSDS